MCVRYPYPDLLADKMLADQKRSEEALVLLEPWAATQPEDAEIWLALGYAALRSNDRFETLRAYGQALRLQPTNREAADAMAGVLLELGAHLRSGSAAAGNAAWHAGKAGGCAGAVGRPCPPTRTTPPFREHGGGLEADRRIIRKSALCEEAGHWPDCAFAP